MTIDVPPLALISASLVIFLIGGLWFSPVLFASRWMHAIDKTMEELGRAHRWSSGYAGALIAAVLVSLATAQVLAWADARGALEGAGIGATMWLGFAVPSHVGEYFFERRPRALAALYLGQHLLAFASAGAILALWRG